MTLFQMDYVGALPVHLELTVHALVPVPWVLHFQVLLQVALLFAGVGTEITAVPGILQHQFLGRMRVAVVYVLPQVMVACEVHSASKGWTGQADKRRSHQRVRRRYVRVEEPHVGEQFLLQAEVCPAIVSRTTQPKFR